MYFAGSIKRGAFFPLESLTPSLKCLLFQPIIWAEYPISVQTITTSAGLLLIFAKVQFHVWKTVKAFDNEIYVLKQSSFYV